MDIFVALLFGALVIVTALAIRGILGQLRGPTTQIVLDALRPHINMAIVAGQTAVIWAFDELEEKIASTDKQAVAESFYALIPDTLVVGRFTLPVHIVKRIVPFELFATEVKNTYDRMDAFLQRNEAYLRSQIDALPNQTIADKIAVQNIIAQSILSPSMAGVDLMTKYAAPAPQLTEDDVPGQG